MTAGIALDDDDRRGWLEILAAKIADHNSQSLGPLFLTCSALKESYSETLRRDCRNLRFIYLHGDREILLQRLNNRKDYFMPASLLDSQLATLEEPENEIRIDIDQDVSELVDECLKKIAVE